MWDTLSQFSPHRESLLKMMSQSKYNFFESHFVSYLHRDNNHFNKPSRHDIPCPLDNKNTSKVKAEKEVFEAEI